MMQAGIELVGSAGQTSDLEVIQVCILAVKNAGLKRFVLDLGHGGIAQSLLSDLPDETKAHLLDSLSLKDGAELSRRARELGLPAPVATAVCSLVHLSGSGEVFERARASLAGTPAWKAVEELKGLYDHLVSFFEERGESLQIVVDLGETRSAAYYTGPMFQILAEGPGRPVASGGRYDALYRSFGVDRPAAGGAIQLDHLRWALGDEVGARRVRAVVALRDDSEQERRTADELLFRLRLAQIPCISCAHAQALDYGRA